MAEDRIPVLEGEVDALREERETLLTRIAELEAALERTEKERDEFFAEAREYWALILELREALAGGGQ